MALLLIFTVVSVSLIQSSNVAASHPSKVGISRSKVVVRFVCHCVAHGLSV